MKKFEVFNSIIFKQVSVDTSFSNLYLLFIDNFKD